MTNLDWSTLTVMGSVFGTGVLVAGYIESRFRKTESMFWKEMRLHHAEDNTRFEDHGRRIQTLEIDRFGVTHHP